MTRAQMLSNLKALIGPGVEVGDADLTIWLNDAYMYMVDELTKANPDYFTDVATTPLYAGRQEYTLPSDYEKMIMVNIQYNNTWRRALPMQSGINQVPVHEFTGSSQNFGPDLPRYYLYGNTPQVIGFMPIPDLTTNGGLKIWYVYTPAELVNDSDVPALPAKYHHIAVLGAHSYYAIEDDNPQSSQILYTRFQDRVDRMVENLSQQQVDEPKSVIITTNYDLYADQGFI